MKISLVETNGNKEYSENSTLKFCNESTPIAIGKRMKGLIKEFAYFFGNSYIFSTSQLSLNESLWLVHYGVFKISANLWAH